MAGPSPNSRTISELKSKILHLAQTSVYQVKLQPTQDVISFLQNRGIYYPVDGEPIELRCTETNLPGSSLATHEITNDYPGVTEKMSYRRIYDETIDFTFYVDERYRVIEFLDGWMNYVTGEGSRTPTTTDRGYFFRMNYPEVYKSDELYITKFEKDNRHTLNYQFIGAFPINVVSMPVSYESSGILKCTASFSYMRYVRTRTEFYRTTVQQPNPSSPANPDVPNVNVPVNTIDGIDGPPTARLNSQQTLNELYEAGRSGRIRSAGEFVGPLQ